MYLVRREEGLVSILQNDFSSKASLNNLRFLNPKLPWDLGRHRDSHLFQWMLFLEYESPHQKPLITASILLIRVTGIWNVDIEYAVMDWRTDLIRISMPEGKSNLEVQKWVQLVNFYSISLKEDTVELPTWIGSPKYFSWTGVAGIPSLVIIKVIINGSRPCPLKRDNLK